MAHPSDQDPFMGLDAGNFVPKYDGSVVAKHVLWPLANSVVKRNWKLDAPVGASIKYTDRCLDKTSVYDIDVELMQTYLETVDDYGESEEDDDFDPVLAERYATGILNMQEIESGAGRERTLDLLYDEYPQALTQYKPTLLIAKRVVSFWFDGDNAFKISSHNIVEHLIDKDENIFWSISGSGQQLKVEGDDDDHRPDTVENYDLDLLRVAVKGLKGPARLQKKINAIQERKI